MVEALGYKRFSNGSFISIPKLCRTVPDVQIKLATPQTCRDGLQPFESELLVAHADVWIISLICDIEGQTYPFVFGFNRKYGVPLAHLVYCRDQKDFIYLAGSLGRLLGRWGVLLVAPFDADGPICGLTGKYIR